MKLLNKIKCGGLMITAFTMLLSACNKLELDPVPNNQPDQGTTPTLATLLDGTDFTVLKAAVTKAGLLPTLSNPALRFTVFAPDDAAITASLPPGVPGLAYIASLDSATVRSLISYHVVPQVVNASTIPVSFPNLQYPTILNPNPAASALLRLTTFPSKRAGIGAWVNNIPITATDVQAVNGVLHKVARVIQPPSVDLWARIASDTDLVYLRAAIARADSGVAVGARLQDALSIAANPSAIGSNLTVFAPTDNAMKAFLIGAITQALVGQGLPLATAQGQATFLVNTFGTMLLTNPYAINGALGATITPTLAKGLVAYHVLARQSGTYAPPGIRVFSVNIPVAPTNVKTLLNSAISVHPGLTVQASFVPGLPRVATATVKGAANATASNVTTPDIHTVNGVIHKIDQALIPQ